MSHVSQVLCRLNLNSAIITQFFLCNNYQIPLHLSSTTMVYTSPTKKARIMEFHAMGISHANIAIKYDLHRTTVMRIVKRVSVTNDFYHVKPKPGRPLKFNVHDLRVAIRKLASTEAHDVSDLQRNFSPSCTPIRSENDLPPLA